MARFSIMAWVQLLLLLVFQVPEVQALHKVEIYLYNLLGETNFNEAVNYQKAKNKKNYEQNFLRQIVDDIGDGIAGIASAFLDEVVDIQNKAGLVHGSVVVHGKEYCFNSSAGIHVDKKPGHWAPGNVPPSATKSVKQIVEVGWTNLSAVQVDKLKDEMQAFWTGSSYDLVGKNCLHFADEFSNKLGAGHMPKRFKSFTTAGQLFNEKRWEDIANGKAFEKLGDGKNWERSVKSFDKLGDKNRWDNVGKAFEKLFR